MILQFSELPFRVSFPMQANSPACTGTCMRAPHSSVRRTHEGDCSSSHPSCCDAFILGFDLDKALSTLEWNGKKPAAGRPIQWAAAEGVSGPQ